MKTTHAAGVAVALGLLTLGCTSFEAAAKSSGLVSGPSHAAKSLVKSQVKSLVKSVAKSAPFRPGTSKHHGAFRRLPLFGGLVAWVPYDDSMPDYLIGDPVETSALPPEPPSALTCKRSEQVVHVPSLDGGTREVRIRRC